MPGQIIRRDQKGGVVANQLYQQDRAARQQASSLRRRYRGVKHDVIQQQDRDNANG